MGNRWKIGSAGVPSGVKNNIEAVKAMREYFNLDAYEVQATRNLNYSDQTCNDLLQNSQKYDVSLSIHAELFTATIGNQDYAREVGMKYVGNALYYGSDMNIPIVVHPGNSYWGPIQARVISNRLCSIISQTNTQPQYIYLEVMGKHSSFGAFEDLLFISREVGTRICIDIAHLWARINGKYGKFSWDYFRNLLKSLENTNWKYQQHFHLSGMIWDNHGEVRHEKLDNSDLPWKLFLLEILRADLGGTIILESGKQDCSDAILTKQVLEELIEYV